MSAEGFNALRLPFAHRSVLDNEPVRLESFDARLNAAFMQQRRTEQPQASVRFLDALLLVIRAAAKRHLVVVMAAERLQADAPTSNLWYNDKLGVDEELVGQSWDRLAEALCGEWNVVGVDLQHEPLLATWGAGNAKTTGIWQPGGWAIVFCERVRDCPFVQGVYEGMQPNIQLPTFFPGENFVNASAFPIRTTQPDKVVLVPHLYGPHTADLDYFHDSDFPDNLPAIWQSHFLAARADTGVPIVVGELGGSLAWS